MKPASIYKRFKEGYVIFGQSKTVSGFRIASEPYFNISELDADPDVIVTAIKASLCNDDNKKAPDPKDWKQLQKDFLKKVGLKYIKELDNHSNKYVAVTEDGKHITFTPSRPAEKPNKGFLHKDKTESIKVDATASNQEIMEAYESTISKCE